MPDADRRVVLLSSAIAREDAAKLSAAVRAAVDVQRRLAEKSAYILNFTGEVRETADGIVVVHEPAEPLSTLGLFDATAPPADTEQLLQTTAALLESMRVAHAGEGGRPKPHGGLCPGVLVRDAAGQIKVTDFGFAQAICAALGAERYVNLAVGPTSRKLAEARVSGCWEVLAEDEFTRDDRLCAYIDPEKYAEDTLKSFETASDVIAAGFILQLLAEHSHPYLPPDPDAHRILDIARSMAGGLPSIVRRKELRESANPGIKLWCELVEQMLERVPRDRPTAADLAKRFEPHVPKIDFERVKALRWIGGLEAALAANEIDSLVTQYENKPTLADWPAEALKRLKPIETKINALREEQRRKAAVEADRVAAQQWFQQFEGCVRAQQWEAAETAWNKRPQLAHFPAEILTAAEPLLESVRAARAELERKQRVQSDHAAVRAWFKSVERAVGAGDWRAAEKLIHSRPTVENWPDDLTEENIAAHEQRVRGELDRIAAEEQSREADLRAAREWIGEARRAFERGELDAAQDMLKARPKLGYFPQNVLDEAAELDASIRVRLEDEIKREISAREERARRAGQHYVVRVVSSQLGKFVDAGMVTTRVTSIEFTPGDEAGDGRAQLNVSLATVADADRGSGLRSGFVFRLAPEPGVVRDEDGTLRDWLVRGLTEKLVGLQQSRLADLTSALHRELFPKAELTCAVSGLTERGKAIVHLLGPGQAGGDLETELRWDPKTLTWGYADAAVFAQKAISLVAARAKKLASNRLLDQSETLKPYKQIISVDVALADKPDPGVIPAGLRLEGRLSLKPEGGEPVVLQTIALKCARVDSLALEGDLKPAEAALREAVIQAQGRSRQALDERLEAQFKSAGVKVRKTPLPKKIAEPVAEVSFELKRLKPKAGPQVTVAATWNASRLAFDTPPAWDATLAGVLEGGGDGAAGGEDDKPSSKRGMFIAIGVVALAGVAAAAYFATRPSPNPQLTPPKLEASVNLHARSLTAEIVGERLRIAYSYEVEVKGEAAIQPYALRIFWDDVDDGVFKAGDDESIRELDGELAVKAHSDTFEHALPAPGPTERRRKLLLVLDSSGWGAEARESSTADNTARTEVTIPKQPAVGAVVELKANRLTEPKFSPDGLTLEISLDYTVNPVDGAAVSPFSIDFFWDSNNDDVMNGAESLLQSVPGDITPGEHQALLKLALPVPRPSTEVKRLVARLNTSRWPAGTTQSPDDDARSVEVSLPPVEPPTVPDLRLKPPTVAPLSAESKEVVVSVAYETVAAESFQPPEFAIKFFWDDGDGALDATKDESIDTVVVSDGKRSGSVELRIPLAAERPEASDRTLFVALDTAGWGPDGERPDGNNASVVVRIPATLPPMTQDVAAIDVTATAESDAIVIKFAYEVKQSRGADVPPFDVRVYWDLDNNNDFDPATDELVGEQPGEVAVKRHEYTGRTPLPSERARKKAETIIGQVIAKAAAWTPAEADAKNNTFSKSFGPRETEPDDPVVLLKSAQPLLDSTQTSEPALAAVLELLAPPAGDDAEVAADRALLTAVAESSASVSDLRAESGGVALNVKIKLKTGAGDVTGSFVMQPVADGAWSGAAEGNRQAIRKLASDSRAVFDAMFQKAADEVARLSESGELAKARSAINEKIKAIDAIREHFLESAALVKLLAVGEDVPVGLDVARDRDGLKDYDWTAPVVEKIGYPERIKDRDGRTLLLVTAPRGDAGGWSLFYIDAAEWSEQAGGAATPVATIEEARQKAASVQRSVPTRAEWTLAALKLRSNAEAANFFGGLAEWCEDVDAGSPGVCGGAARYTEKNPPPGAAAADDEVLAWLKRPLVTQKREYGDGIAGLRTILRVHPPATP